MELITLVLILILVMFIVNFAREEDKINEQIRGNELQAKYLEGKIAGRKEISEIYDQRIVIREGIAKLVVLQELTQLHAITYTDEVENYIKKTIDEVHNL